MKRYISLIIMIVLGMAIFSGCTYPDKEQKILIDETLGRLEYISSDVMIEKHISNDRYQTMYYLIKFTEEDRKYETICLYNNVKINYILGNNEKPNMKFKLIPSNITEKRSGYVVTVYKGIYAVEVNLPKNYIIEQKSVNVFKNPIYNGGYLKVID